MYYTVVKYDYVGVFVTNDLYRVSFQKKLFIDHEKTYYRQSFKNLI